MLKIDDEPVIFLTKSAYIALATLLGEYAQRADAGQEVRKLYTEFVQEVMRSNPDTF